MILLIINIFKKYDIIWRFLLHVATGAISVCAHYLVMALILSFNCEPSIASGIGFFFGALIRFITAYYHVFNPRGSINETLPKFILALVIQGSLNLVLLNIFMYLNGSVWIAQLMTTLIITFLNYYAYYIWVFK